MASKFPQLWPMRFHCGLPISGCDPCLQVVFLIDCLLMFLLQFGWIMTKKRHITNLVPALVWFWGKIIAVAVVLLMLAVRCSFKPEMHQFHSFTVSLKNLRASYPGAVSCLNQKGLGIGKTKNKYLENIYIYICIYSSISGIQVQVSILLGWLSLKDLSFLILLRCVVDIYIYMYMCYLQWRLLREVHVQHLRIPWGFTTSVLWSWIFFILMW